MLASVITVVSALAASVVAVPDVQAREVLASWPATNFQKACTPGHCQAMFDISAPAGYAKDAPAFKVTCKAPQNQAYVKCESASPLAKDSSVQSMFTDGASKDAMKISVFHIWNEGATTFNASGSVEVTPSATGFTLPVTSLTGIA